MLKVTLYTIDNKQVGKSLISQDEMLFDVLEAAKDGLPVRQEDEYFVWHNPRHVYTAKIEQIEGDKNGSMETGKLEAREDKAESEEPKETQQSQV